MQDECTKSRIEGHDISDDVVPQPSKDFVDGKSPASSHLVQVGFNCTYLTAVDRESSDFFIANRNMFLFCATFYADSVESRGQIIGTSVTKFKLENIIPQKKLEKMKEVVIGHAPSRKLL